MTTRKMIENTIMFLSVLSIILVFNFISMSLKPLFIETLSNGIQCWNTILSATHSSMLFNIYAIFQKARAAETDNLSVFQIGLTYKTNRKRKMTAGKKRSAGLAVYTIGTDWIDRGRI